MKIRSHYKNRPEATPQVGFKPSKTEKAGYIPAKQRIEGLLRAGRLLQDTRNEMYDTTDPNADVPLDPTRRKDFDLADASSLKAEVRDRLVSRLPLKKPVMEVKKADSKPSKDDVTPNEKPQ